MSSRSQPGPQARLPELLAPAGGEESLRAAVLCGADAVYLGGRRLSARAGAHNFDRAQLRQAVLYCHAREVKVYQALNTVLFDDELSEAVGLIAEACEAGVDALILQDPALARLARSMAPDMPLHASTQMSVHNLEGVYTLQRMGFRRVVLARELSRREIAAIAARSPLELECFVHGALCMCVSGQCYLSGMLGGRSGNRGQCAQPCRLPFAPGAGGEDHALSLRDLSLVRQIPDLARLGVASLKIEGRLKRPEYVAAATAACRRTLQGLSADLDALEAVFSRSGFTDGYYKEELGPGMFGTRGREDVAAAAGVLGALAESYRREQPRVPLSITLSMEADQPALLRLRDARGRAVQCRGEIPQIARTAPTTEEKARAALSKTGGTPYFVEQFTLENPAALMLPVSALNALRRAALEELDRQRAGAPVPCGPIPTLDRTPHYPAGKQEIRVRLRHRDQLSAELLAHADRLILPLEELLRLAPRELAAGGGRWMAELPRMLFSTDTVREQLERLRTLPVTELIAGNPGGVALGRELGFAVHGDFGLNITNSLSLEEWAGLGLQSATLSPEISRERALALGGELPRGILAYGHLPLMVTRNAPGGRPPADRTGFALTDRKGIRFRVEPGPKDSYWELHNSVPLYLADRLGEWRGMDFLTLYFTTESAAGCAGILEGYRGGWSLPEHSPKTRGLYYRPLR